MDDSSRTLPSSEGPSSSSGTVSAIYVAPHEQELFAPCQKTSLRRTSSVSSASSTASTHPPSLFDKNATAEEMLTTLRKIVNSATTGAKPKPRLTIPLQQVANSILDQLESRRYWFSPPKASAKPSQVALHDFGVQTTDPPPAAFAGQENIKDLATTDSWSKSIYDPDTADPSHKQSMP
ncbi:hypothetical protein AVEN_227321-1 [Araneus ventricosus]|uniref:Uncharacterized protein n=1 Tax=Araneus ventricosus TaxID=182803 RepID=A0A4Y2GUL1_ARAVE|nr:hypothetical protein AVEN_227321-1 [Araneus ventricosus]